MILASAFQGSLGQNLNLWFGMYFAWISTILIVNFEFERLGLILSWKLTGYFHGFWHLGMALWFWLVHLVVWFWNLNFLDLVCFEIWVLIVDILIFILNWRSHSDRYQLGGLHIYVFSTLLSIDACIVFVGFGSRF